MCKFLYLLHSAKQRKDFSMENVLTNNQTLLSPKIDVVFQALFGEVGNEQITSKFLEAILQKKITTIDLSRKSYFKARI